MRRVDLAKPREERLRCFGVFAKAPVHHRELQQHALLVFELLSRAERALVNLRELVPGFELRVVVDQGAERLFVGWRVLENLPVGVRCSLPVSERAPKDTRGLKPGPSLLLPGASRFGRTHIHGDHVLPALAGAKAQGVLARGAHVRRVRGERLVEDGVGLVDGVVAAVLPHQRRGTREQRGLEPRVRGVARFFDETLCELAPLVFDLVKLIDGLRHLGVVGLDAPKLLVRIERTVIVHQLFATDATELLDQDLLELGIIGDELRLDLHEPRSR